VTAQRQEMKFQDSPVAVSAYAAAPPPPPEQLGDLKLYRVPQRTTVAGMQMKQTRLVEQRGVPFERIHTATISVFNYGGEERPQTSVILRTRNDKEHQLGLPLPSGSFVIQQEHWGRSMLIATPDLRDTAEDEKIELDAGDAPDVTVSRRVTSRESQSTKVEVEVANASPHEIVFELRVPIDSSWRISESDANWEKRDGVPIFTLRIPAEGSVKLHYTARAE
jgi:hypothetical protein